MTMSNILGNRLYSVISLASVSTLCFFFGKFVGLGSGFGLIAIFVLAAAPLLTHRKDNAFFPYLFAIVAVIASVIGYYSS